VRVGERRCFGRGDRIDKFFNLGRENLAREISVIRLVRSLRVVEKYLADSVPDKKHQRMKAEAKRVPVDDME